MRAHVTSKPTYNPSTRHKDTQKQETDTDTTLATKQILTELSSTHSLAHANTLTKAMLHSFEPSDSADSDGFPTEHQIYQIHKDLTARPKWCLLGALAQLQIKNISPTFQSGASR